MARLGLHEVTTVEQSVLETFLYLAIYQAPNAHPLPKSIVYNPNIARYIRDFGKSEDIAIMAKKNGEVVGFA